MKFIDRLKQKLIPKEFRDQAALDKTTQDFAQKVEAAAAIADPAGRLLAALEAQQGLDRHAKYVGYKLRSKSDAAGGLIFGVSNIGGLALGMLVASTLSPVVGLCLFLGGFVLGTGNLMGGWSDAAMERFFYRRLHEHIGKLQDADTKAADIIKSTLEANTTAIAASQKFGQIYDSFPEIRDHFIKTFNQAAARGELPAPPPPAPNPKTGLKL